LGLAASPAITIDTVIVGDPDNASDITGYGWVNYTYNIGKYEVTAGQYCAFLNAVAKTDTYGLYNTLMADTTNYRGCNIQRTGTSGNYSYSVAPDWANRPVNYVSFWDACRFANWLHNGQPTGDQDLTTTEDGAYYLNGYTGNDGRWIQRKADWRWAVTSEDEWYKAAYYKGGGTSTGYWLYPTQSNTTPSNRLVNPDLGNNATYYSYLGYPNVYTIGGPYWRTEVGAHGNSESAYGTFDQGGNVSEWNESLVLEWDYACRGLRGGSYEDTDTLMRSTCRSYYFPDEECFSFGFRVSQAIYESSTQVTPEPSSVFALLVGLTGAIGLKRRKS
ncbi:MAG: SUMF1/EgtB/PvdO family nonheme iron enzyme, partial [Armatimonadetes bacterium]|nr:SUMF1/EgtB/PvdO family nonheme iron enzyme [Armatimonadota bacterium]